MNPFDEYAKHVIQHGFDIPEPPQRLPVQQEKESLWAAFGIGVVAGIVFLAVAAFMVAEAMWGDREK